jgi:hypothetical protein
MDFVSDALFDGRRLRALTVVDAYTGEGLAIEVDQSIKGEQVADVMTRLAVLRGAPSAIRVDNGPEFVSKALDRWAYANDVTLDFSRPGKPTDNAFVESVNGRLQDECLNAHWFLSLADAKAKIEAWRRQYNESRPHTALVDALGICLGRSPDGGRMNPGSSPSGRTKTRGTVKSTSGSRSDRMKDGGHVKADRPHIVSIRRGPPWLGIKQQRLDRRFFSNARGAVHRAERWGGRQCDAGRRRARLADRHR